MAAAEETPTAVGREGLITLERAEYAARELREFTKAELAMRLGIKPIAVGRFLTVMKALGVVECGDAVNYRATGVRPFGDEPDLEPVPDFEAMEVVRQKRLAEIVHFQLLTALRDAVIALRRFTIMEVADYLGVERGEAKTLLGELPEGMVADTGRRWKNSPLYVYVPPESPKFLSRPRGPDLVARAVRECGPIAGTGRPKWSNNKDVNALVEAATAGGWRVERRKSHPAVIPPVGRPIPVPTTPKGGGMVRAFRDQLRNAGLNVDGLVDGQRREATRRRRQG